MATYADLQEENEELRFCVLELEEENEEYKKELGHARYREVRLYRRIDELKRALFEIELRRRKLFRRCYLC